MCVCVRVCACVCVCVRGGGGAGGRGGRCYHDLFQCCSIISHSQFSTVCSFLSLRQIIQVHYRLRASLFSNTTHTWHDTLGHIQVYLLHGYLSEVLLVQLVHCILQVVPQSLYTHHTHKKTHTENRKWDMQKGYAFPKERRTNPPLCYVHK